MVQGPDDVAPSPGGDSAASSSKRGASPDAGSGANSELSRKKKKMMGPGSRGVAYLTPEQLAKKRENDREAQRNIRKRTKDQIENLERQIQELTSQQPYQEYLAMKRAKEAVERENAEIKRRLASIVGEVQALVGSDLGRAYASPTQSYQSAPNSANLPAAPSGVPNASTPVSAGSPGSAELTASQSWQSGSGAGGPPQCDQARTRLVHQQHEMRHGLDMGPERLGLGFLLDPHQRVAKIQNGSNGAQDTSRYHHVPMKHDWTSVQHDHVRPSSSGNSISSWEASGGNEDDKNLAVTGRQGQGGKPEAVSPQLQRDATGGHPPRWAKPVVNCEPTCTLDSLLLDFLYERHQRAAEGLSVQEVVGPRYPSVSSLLNPSHSIYSHPLSKVFTDILATFPDIRGLPERVAVLYIMFLVMRWQISPTQENYRLLPDWMHPSDLQLVQTHPAWVDHVPFPLMRDKLVREYGKAEEVPLDNFFIPFTKTLRLNWPYEDTDALLQHPDGEELMINPVFERHLRNLDNWSLGSAFAKAFPSLQDVCRIRPNS